MWFLLPLLISTVFSATGSAKAGNAARRAGEAAQRASESEAELTDWNALVADLQAKDALDRGTEEERRFREGIAGVVGSLRADQAASNINVHFGSAADTQADAAYLGELDVLTIRTNAMREAWGFQVQAQDLRRRALIIRKEGVNQAAAGRAQQSASRFAVAGTIAGGIAEAGMMYQRYGFRPTTPAPAPPTTGGGWTGPTGREVVRSAPYA